MNPLRLGACGVSAPEVGLIRALVRLIGSGGSTGFLWTFSETEPYDAVVADSVVADTCCCSKSGAKLRLTNACSDVDMPDTVVRPIHADVLESWLRHVQERIAHPPQAVPRVDLASIPPQECHRRYRLRRWPPVQLLHRDQLRIRMATFLSRQALTIPELAQATRASLNHSHTFITLLRQMDLLEVVPMHRAATPSTGVEPAKPPPGLHWLELGHVSSELVHSLRLRLGL